ncbi:MAG: succinate dehydrogenase cytochrome b subunit [Solirubrobacterales bacterium]|nr:succinate dehydrogenase cytochrome b subunit [Solirubrobacterales bacterium]
MSSEAPSLGGATGSGEQPRLRWLREVWGSTLGKKIIVAVTGVILAAYVILHALGNLKALQGPGDEGGPAAIDEYADFLRDVGGPVIPAEGLLWIVRAILLAALVIHVVGVSQLIKRNRAARPDGEPPVIRRTFASRTMATSGFLLLAFIVFHILQFTTLTIHPTPLAEGAVYANVYNAFQEWWIVAIYVAMMVVLFLHLRHALWSLLQTLGWDKPNRNPTFRRGATATAVFVSVAFASVPILAFAGALPEPGSGSSDGAVTAGAEVPR